MSHDSSKTAAFRTDSFFENHLLDLQEFKECLDHEDIPLFGSLPELFQTLRQHLGLDVRFVRTGGTMPKEFEESFAINVSGGQSPGQLVLLSMPNIRKPKLVGHERSEFLSAFAQFLGDTYRWQQELRHYKENPFSDGLPSFDSSDFDPSESYRSEETLHQLLKESAKLADYSAASLYSLDSSQKTLKLRSCWGLPEERLLSPPKKLHDSLADLEAVLGQAVVVNEDYLFETWKVPENFPMAICLPVISPQTLFGTLWFFSDRRRDCTDHEIRLLEYIAGRLAAELEKSGLYEELRRKK